MRAAMAISSTMFTRRWRLRSPSLAFTGTPPSERATTAPPARSCELLCQEAIRMVPITISRDPEDDCGFVAQDAQRIAAKARPARPG